MPPFDSAPTTDLFGQAVAPAYDEHDLQALALLKETRDYLAEHPDQWCSGNLAENIGGDEVGIHCGSAVARCAYGTMAWLYDHRHGKDRAIATIVPIVMDRANSKFFPDMVAVNDQDGRTMVIQRIDAILKEHNYAPV